MKKRQANEVIAEIEAKWKARHGCSMWSWSLEHIAFLVKRWEWKHPEQIERTRQIASDVAQNVQQRIQTGCSPHWLYVPKERIVELMEGAGLNTSIPERKPIEHDRVIELKPRG